MEWQQWSFAEQKPVRTDGGAQQYSRWLLEISSRCVFKTFFYHFLWFYKESTRNENEEVLQGLSYPVSLLLSVPVYRLLSYRVNWFYWVDAVAFSNGNGISEFFPFTFDLRVNLHIMTTLIYTRSIGIRNFEFTLQCFYTSFHT